MGKRDFLGFVGDMRGVGMDGLCGFIGLGLDFVFVIYKLYDFK